MFDKKGPPHPNGSNEVRRAWHGLSAYDTEEGVRQQAVKRKGKLGSLIVRYDVPEAAGVDWEKTFGPGHHSLFGNLAELKHYLSDRVVDI